MVIKSQGNTWGFTNILSFIYPVKSFYIGKWNLIQPICLCSCCSRGNEFRSTIIWVIGSTPAPSYQREKSSFISQFLQAAPCLSTPWWPRISAEQFVESPFHGLQSKMPHHDTPLPSSLLQELYWCLLSQVELPTQTWEKCLKIWNFALSTDTCITPLVSKKLDAALSNSPLGNHLSKIKNLVCLPPNCATTSQDVLVFFFRSQSSPTASLLNLILCFLNLCCLLVLCSDVPVWEITWETS